MQIKKGFNKNYNKWFVKDVLHAIQRYSLIDQGERVCVALSGGKDSATLLFILDYINHFSYLKFDLSAIHIRTAEYDTSLLREFCDALEVSYTEERLEPERDTVDKNRCYICARLKRGAISELLGKQGIKKLAYGHHADDVAETFFMNILQNKKLGSFSPRVELVDNPVIIIRPMIYLEESLIQRIHRYAGLPVIEFKCPYAQDNIRKKFKASMSQMNLIFGTSGFARKLVESLENVDFTNIWQNL